MNRRRQRRNWISKLNAGLSNHNIGYAPFIKLQQDKNIALNRKILAELAHHEPLTFAAIVGHVKTQENGQLEDRVSDKKFRNSGYMSSVVVTYKEDVFQYPVRPKGRRNPSVHSEAAKFVKKDGIPNLLSRTPFVFANQEAYIQKHKTHEDFALRAEKKLIAENPSKTRQEQARMVKETFPDAEEVDYEALTELAKAAKGATRS